MLNRISLVPAAVVLLGLVHSIGCQAVRVKGPAAPSLQQAAAHASPPATIEVEIREGYRQKSRTKRLALTEPLTVQQLLAKTGALSEFSRMFIVIERPVPGQRLPLKLNVPFEPKSHAVAAGRDYSIHPGDKIVITEDKRTIIERLLEQATDMMGPLAPM